MSTNSIAFSINPSLMASNLTVLEENGSLWAVTGRIPGKDDDHTHFVLCSTQEQAMNAFTFHAYESAGRDMPMPGDEDYREDEVIYVTDYHELGIRLLLPESAAHAAVTVSDETGYIPNLPDLPISVTAVDGSTVEWLISPNLTDRWGEINDHAEEKKPLHELVSQPELLEALRDQMTAEVTFIARKDGVYGLLFEVEYESIESDGTESGGVSSLKPYDDVVARIITGMQQNAHRFPSVVMCVPPADEICNDRPAAWAFVPHSAMHEDAREELALFLNSL